MEKEEISSRMLRSTTLHMLQIAKSHMLHKKMHILTVQITLISNVGHKKGSPCYLKSF